jgi:hypothetical protein
MGGSVGKVVSVVAAVAIPVYAPGIAASFGVSSAINTAIGAAAGSTIGTVAGSAIVGAGLGAVSAVVTGQPISRGATAGFIGGGIGGGIEALSGADAIYGGPAVDAAGNPIPGAAQGATATTVTAPVPVGATNPLAGADMSAVGRLTQQGGGAARQAAGLTGLGTVDARNTGRSLQEVARTTGSQVLDKVLDADKLASLTVQAVGQLTAAALYPDSGLPGFSEEEKELVEARRKEMEELRIKDNEAYEQQIALSKQLLVQAGYVDPTYFANQAANTAAIQNARAIQEQRERDAFNPLLTEFNTAQLNQQSIDAAKNRQAAFDTGFLKGVDMRSTILGNIGDAIPKAPTQYSVLTADLQDDLSKAEDRAVKGRQNVANFTAGLNTTTGRSPEDEANLARITKNVTDGMTGLTSSGQDSTNYLRPNLGGLTLSYDDDEVADRIAAGISKGI